MLKDKLNFDIEDIFYNLLDDNKENILSNETSEKFDAYYAQYIEDKHKIDWQAAESEWEHLSDVTNSFSLDGFKSGFKTALSLILSL